jgi:hypothetical protein
VNAVLESPVHAALARHRARWRDRLRIFPGGAFDERSTILTLPRLVAEAYPPVDAAKLAELTVALSLFSDGIVAYDDIIDCAPYDPREARRLPQVAVLFAQAYRTFAELFGGAPWFWDRLEAHFIDYVDALAAEARFASDDEPWRVCDEALVLGIARGKNGLVRLVDTAVAALAGERDGRGLESVLLDGFLAHQMVDDLRDWREDVRDGNPSLLLCRACTAKPRGGDAEAIGRRIYRDGHAEHVLLLAERTLRGAAASAAALGAHAFGAALAEREERVARLRERVRAEVAVLEARAS